MSNQKYEQQRFRFPMLKGIVPIRRSQLPSESKIASLHFFLAVYVKSTYWKSK